MRPYCENSCSISFWLMVLGRPLTYKLASRMEAELGRAQDTWQVGEDGQKHSEEGAGSASHSPRSSCPRNHFLPMSPGLLPYSFLIYTPLHCFLCWTFIWKLLKKQSLCFDTKYVPMLCYSALPLSAQSWGPQIFSLATKASESMWKSVPTLYITSINSGRFPSSAFIHLKLCSIPKAHNSI